MVRLLSCLCAGMGFLLAACSSEAPVSHTGMHANEEHYITEGNPLADPRPNWRVIPRLKLRAVSVVNKSAIFGLLPGGTLVEVKQNGTTTPLPGAPQLSTIQAVSRDLMVGLGTEDSPQIHRYRAGRWTVIDTPDVEGTLNSVAIDLWSQMVLTTREGDTYMSNEAGT